MTSSHTGTHHTHHPSASPTTSAPTTDSPTTTHQGLSTFSFVFLVLVAMVPYYISAIICAKATGEEGVPFVPRSVERILKRIGTELGHLGDTIAEKLGAAQLGGRSHSGLDFDDEIDDGPHDIRNQPAPLAK